MAGRPGFMVYFEDWQPLEALDDAQFREVFRAAFQFSRDGEAKTISDPVANMAFLMLQPRIAADRARYERKVEQARNAGSQSAEARANVRQRPLTPVNETNVRQRIEPTQPNSITNYNSNCSYTPAEQERATRSKGFTPPTADEVREYGTKYAHEKGLHVDTAQEAEAFVDFYASKAWRVGKSPMANWQASLRRWLREAAKSRASPTVAAPRDYASNDLSDEALYG